MSERIIMGIDPGTIVMGYGLIEVRGQEARLLALGVISLSKYEDHYLRLKRIFERVQGLIDEFHPDELAIEAPFFGKNVQSMLKLAAPKVWRWRQPSRAISPSPNTSPCVSSRPSQGTALPPRSKSQAWYSAT